MAANIKGVLRAEIRNAVKKSKVLLVGVGGIGCEVLKNLVLTGFGELEVIDAATVEVSDLSRQLLFSRETVGKPKSHVARDSALKFNPDVNITSHFGDVMDPKHDVFFFNKFDLVIMALGNKEACAYVNRMCLPCQIPLIESSTNGYNGQVELIKKGFTKCYDCYFRSEPPKTHSMCTILTAPTQPIHCVIWAKHLFKELFSSSVALSSFQTLSARLRAIVNDYDPKKLFIKVFFDDIKCLSVKKSWYAYKNIRPLDKSVLAQEHIKYSHVLDTEILTLEQSISMFWDCITPLKEKWKKSPNNRLVWDKDDKEMMNFVVASSNLRSAIFSIPLTTYFDIKTMATPNIPAIVTTDAIIAGQIVIHALKILQGDYNKCQSVFLRSIPNREGEVLVKDTCLQPSNPRCNVCFSKVSILVTDVNRLTLRQFEELVLKKKMRMVRPDVTVGFKLIISSFEDDKLNLSDKTLSEVGMTHGYIFMAIDDFREKKVMIFNKEKLEGDPEFQIFKNLEYMLTTYKIKPYEEEGSEKINNKEISDEVKLVIKKKFDEAIEDINDAKKIRVH